MNSSRSPRGAGNDTRPPDDRPDAGIGAPETDRSYREGLLRSVWREFQRSDSLNVAGSIAFFAFLSFPPAIIVLFALTGFFGGDEVARWVTDHLSDLLPEESAALIEGFVQSVVYEQAPGPLSIGLVLALWSGSNVFMAVLRATNLAYGIEDRRGFVHQRSLAVGTMLLFVLLFLSASTALLAGPAIASALDPFGVVAAVWTLAHWPLAILVVVAAFWIVYFLLPARAQKRSNREILIGALVATVIWLLGTVGFRLFISNFGSYNETYGFLGAIIMLLLWLYLTGVVLLLGAHFAAELERRSFAK